MPGIVVVAVDVTKHVLARRELERVNRELEEFAYVAGHDLQEPLRMVNIYSQLLLRLFSGGHPEAEEYVSFVRQGMKRMESLIRDLLAYSRAVRNDEPAVGQADVSVALHDARSVLESRIDESRATITTDALPTVRGDTGQLAQVFQNLPNSLKYRRKDVPCRIHIGANRDSERGSFAYAITGSASTRSTQKESSGYSNVCTRKNTRERDSGSPSANAS